MKWYIVPEQRDEMIRNAYRGGRGGHRGSSNPSSPNQLNYVNQGPKDLAARDHGSARKRKVSPSGSPQPRSALRESHTTPERGPRRLLPEEPAADGSPLARMRRLPGTASTNATESGPRSPTLGSSFLPEDGAPFVTPAPHRVEVKLAPPSTLQRPSQHMPTSSPAPFWKYADYGSTPMKAPPLPFDGSPSKPGAAANLPASSSPPQVTGGGDKTPVASPTKAKVEEPEAEEGGAAAVEEDGGFDLTKFVDDPCILMIDMKLIFVSGVSKVLAPTTLLFGKVCQSAQP
jgi:forkhead protein FKH